MKYPAGKRAMPPEHVAAQAKALCAVCAGKKERLLIDYAAS